MSDPWEYLDVNFNIYVAEYHSHALLVYLFIYISTRRKYAPNNKIPLMGNTSFGIFPI